MSDTLYTVLVPLMALIAAAAVVLACLVVYGPIGVIVGFVASYALGVAAADLTD